MAPTSIEFEATRLVTAEPVRRSARSAARKPTRRHQNLLKHVTRLVAGACPPYLRNDQDDIVQTVLIRLNRKLDDVTQDLESCRGQIRRHGQRSSAEIAATLRRCLAEIEKAWDRSRSRKVRKHVKKCLAWAAQESATTSPQDALRSLDACLGRLRKVGGKEVFSEAYIYQGVHWAILDAKKKLARRAEVSPEEREDGSSEWDLVLDTTVSGPRSMVLREKILDCIARLDSPKRRPTVLALLGYEYSEIAEFLALSLPQADSRIRRGKAFLRRCLNLKGVVP